MKVKVIRPYTDKELSKNMVVGTEFETSNERAKVLIDKDFCIAIESEITIDAEKVIKTQPIIQSESLGLIVEKPKQTRKRRK